MADVAKARIDAVNMSESIFYQTIKPLFVKEQDEESKSFKDSKAKFSKILQKLKLLIWSESILILIHIQVLLIIWSRINSQAITKRDQVVVRSLLMKN